MAFSSLGSKVWGSGPAITFNFSYEKQRSGANMKYRVRVVIESLTGPHYFGYPIYMKTSMNGSVKETKTLKSASPSQWSSDISYTTPWYTISNKTTGSTSLSLNIYSGSGNSRNNTYSFSMKVDPAASVLGSIGNFTIGNAINIPITKYSDDFKDTLVISLGGTTIKTIDKITNGYDVNFSSSELNTIYSKLPTATSGSFTFKLTTKSGNTTVGSSSKTATGSVSSNIKPSISNIGIAEAGSTPANWGLYLKNKSKIRFTISASAGNGSSISSIKTSFNGSTYSGSDITTNTVNTSGNIIATITATDKRGRSVSTTKSINVVDYASPYISNINAFRCNPDGVANDKGTSIKIEIAGEVSSINGKNTHSYKVQWKKSTDSGWQEHIFNINENTINSSIIINNIKSASSYEVKGTISDYFTSIDKMAKTIPSVFRTLSFKAGGRGIAIGKIAEKDNLFDIGLKTRFSGGIDPIELGEGVDLNDITNPGFYFCPYDATASKILNVPMPSAFSLMVEKHAGFRQTLTIYWVTNPVTYVRSFYNNTWGKWFIMYPEQYDIGHVLITSTNKNPSDRFGGTWVLVDKEITNISDWTDSDTSFFTPNNLYHWVFRYTISKNTLFLDIEFQANFTMTDTWGVIGTVHYDKLGFTRIGHTANSVGFCDRRKRCNNGGSKLANRTNRVS